MPISNWKKNQRHYRKESAREQLFGDILYNHTQRTKVIFSGKVRLNVSATKDQLIILCDPNKEEVGEVEALKAVELLSRMLESYGVPFISTSRNSIQSNIGDKTDRLVIKRVGSVRKSIVRAFIQRSLTLIKTKQSAPF